MHELMTHINTTNGRIVMTLEASTILILSKSTELVNSNINKLIQTAREECPELEVYEDLNDVQRLLNESLADLVKYESSTAVNIPTMQRRVRVLVIRDLMQMEIKAVEVIKEVITNNHLYGLYIIAGTSRAPNDVVTKLFQSKLVLLTTAEDSLQTIGQPYACLNFRQDRAVFKCEIAGIESTLVGV